MVTNDTGDKSSRVGPPEVPAFRRLFEARGLIAAFAALLVILAVAGVVSATAALVMLAGLIVLVALIRRDEAAMRPTSLSRPADQTWPDTGIKLFAEALPSPCLVLDRRGIIRFANHRAFEAFSVRPGDPLSFRLRVPDLLAAFDRVAKGGPAEGVDFAERVPTERWFAAWFAPLDAGHRQASFVALILDDLTERRRSERIRVDFVANASHELRTPLASLVGFIETLQGPARNDVEARERFLAVMREQANRMSRLVDDLLSLSRIEMKQHVRPSGEVDLCSVIRHLSDAMEPLSRDMKVTIATRHARGAGHRRRRPRRTDPGLRESARERLQIRPGRWPRRRHRQAGGASGGCRSFRFATTGRGFRRSTFRASPSASTGSTSTPVASTAAPVSGSPSSSISSPVTGRGWRSRAGLARVQHSG